MREFSLWRTFMPKLMYAVNTPRTQPGSNKRTVLWMAMGLGLLSITSPLSRGQAPSAAPAFAIAGHSGTAPVIQVGGRSYVSAEDVARLTQGSLSFRPDQILLTLSGPPASAPPTSAPPKQGFSRDFLTSAIEAMAVIRELRIEIANAIQNNYPLSAAWIADQSRKAETSLALVSAAISTDDDRSAYSLLTGQYGNVKRFRDKFLAAKSAARYIDPSSIDNDPLNQQIMSCTHALQAMAAQDKFWDEPSCH